MPVYAEDINNLRRLNPGPDIVVPGKPPPEKTVISSLDLTLD